MRRFIGRFFILVVIFIMGVMVVLPPALADQGHATVIASALNMRSSPGGSIIATLPFGTVVHVDGREDQAGNGGIWVLATPVEGGPTGWMLSDHLEFHGELSPYSFPVVAIAGSSSSSGDTSAPAPTGDGSATVRVTSNVRTGPGTGYQKLGVAPAGSGAAITGRNSSGTWLFGNIGGINGWIYASLVNFNGSISSLPVVDATGTGSTGVSTPAPTSSGDGSATVRVTSNVRTGPGTGYSKLGTVPAGSGASVTGRNSSGTWLYGNIGGIDGWIYASLVNFNGSIASLPVVDTTGTGTTPTASQPAPTGDGSATTRVTSNIRSGPGTNYSKLGTVAAGTPITITGRNSSGTWLYGNMNGIDGWIYASLVNFNGSIASLPLNETVVASSSSSSSNPPPTSGGTIFSGFGYGAHIAGFGNADRMYQAGMSWVKIQVRYGWGDDPSYQAGAIQTAHSQGFRILLGVVGHAGDVVNGDNYFNAYAGYVAGLAGLGADAIEVWNEPNIDREWATGAIDAGQYTRLLALSYNAIKSTNSSTMVVSGALAPTGFFGGCAAQGCDDAVFLSGMRSAGAASYMDCVGAHYNEGIVPPSWTSGDPRGGHYTRYYWGMVNTYYNAMGRPVCFTELGYVTPEGIGPLPPYFSWGNDNTLAEHATWIADAIYLGSTTSRVKLVIIWNLNFPNVGGGDPMGAYAMIRPDGSCPACDVLESRK